MPRLPLQAPYFQIKILATMYQHDVCLFKHISSSSDTSRFRANHQVGRKIDLTTLISFVPIQVQVAALVLPSFP
jgi:hypothetical protein